MATMDFTTKPLTLALLTVTYVDSGTCLDPSARSTALPNCGWRPRWSCGHRWTEQTPNQPDSTHLSAAHHDRSDFKFTTTGVIQEAIICRFREKLIHVTWSLCHGHGKPGIRNEDTAMHLASPLQQTGSSGAETFGRSPPDHHIDASTIGTFDSPLKLSYCP
ncbi:hypothetical protein N656DRAFT_649782 [Canariomyces notabilis]|uniref:Uncharacterized protein n=1 Tax=Canariomyces notabilis TaxID=2074819 RepID=A0AAN6YSZ9_9PEZI|nr:hypothetical protein N656DRAFT_649782 [Canariomyces arenarius]